MAAGSPSSSGMGDLPLPASASTSPVPSHSNIVRIASGSTQTGTDPIPPPAPSKTSAGVTTPSFTPAGSGAKAPARLPTSPPSCSKIKAMLARAAKARGSGKQAHKKDRNAASPTVKIPSTSPPPAAPSKDHIINMEEEKAVFILAPAADIPSRSRSRGATSDEVVSRFVAFCPGGSLINMAKLPTEILVAKGASVLAEVNFYFLSYYLFPSSWKLLTPFPFCRVSSLLWPWRSSC